MNRFFASKIVASLGVAGSVGLILAFVVFDGRGGAAKQAVPRDASQRRNSDRIEAQALQEAVSQLVGRQVYQCLPLAQRESLVRAYDRAQAGTSMPFLCFAPGTPDDVITAFNLALGWGQRSQLTARWSATATDGGGLAQGQPTTLTYSFVPDGTFVPNRAGFSGNSSLISWLNGLYGSQAVWQPIFAQIFGRWAELSGLTYIFEPNDDGVTLNDNPGQLGVRGDLRIAAIPIDGNSNILAYNIFPDDGDMVLDSGDTFYSNMANNSIGLRNVVAHEHGHGMGLLHVCPLAKEELMEPQITLTFDGPQHDDIRGVQRQYGDPFEDNDTAPTATDVGALLSGSSIDLGAVPAPAVPFGSLLSIDGAGDDDWFRFQISGPLPVSVTVTPVGRTYDDSPQGCPGGGAAQCCSGNLTDSLRIADLNVQVVDSDGVTVLVTANSQPAGTAETTTVTTLPAAGSYFVRVFAGDVPTDTQLYSLSISCIATDCNANGVADSDDIANGTSLDCNNNGIPDECEFSVFLQQAKLTAADATQGSRFGFSVSISGNTAVIGALFDSNAASQAGSAYVFVRSGGIWTQQAKLTAADATQGDNFGNSVSISGDIVVIGSPSANGAAAFQAGSAYVFVRSGGIWTQEAKLIAADAVSFAAFGSSVSISSGTAVIGAEGDDNGAGAGAGSAYVFVRSGGLWTQQAKLTAADASAGDFFGNSVSINGDTAVIGARSNSDAGSFSGSAYVFVRSGGLWTQQAKLTAADASAGDIFGWSVSNIGDTAIIGAPGSNSVVFNNSGSAYVFVRSGALWTQQAKLTAADAVSFAAFGSSVSINSDAAVIGAKNDSAAGGDSGSAYVFVRSGGLWTQQAKLTAADASTGDFFGISVSISNDTAVMGASNNSDAGSFSGSSYIFAMQSDCNTNGIPDECDIAAGASQDCNSNGIPDECDIAAGTSMDGDNNGIPDECEDCNGNGVLDATDIASGTSQDCNSNGIPDECDIASGISLDCNANAIPDECDITSGTSQDCNGNSIPDECEIDAASMAPGGPFFCTSGCDPDCNTNGIPDACDISAGTSQDCNGNGIPDECDITSGTILDCNANGIPDECDITSGTSQDCNTNNIPDECEIDATSMAPGGPFFCGSGCDPDCNGNGIPDACDIAAGTSMDNNANGIPDECDCDLDGDLDVDVDDFVLFVSTYAHCAGGAGFIQKADADGDGCITLVDYQAWIACFRLFNGISPPLTSNTGEQQTQEPSFQVAPQTPGSDNSTQAARATATGSRAVQALIGLGAPPDQTLAAGTNVFRVGDTFLVQFILVNAGAPTLGWGIDPFVQNPSVAQIITPPTIGPFWVPVLSFDQDGFSALAFPDSIQGLPLLATVTMKALGVGETDVHGLPTQFDLTEGFAADPTGFLNTFEIAAHIIVIEDCNNNGVSDADDIASGTSQDCNANGIPDECELVQTVSFGSGPLTPIDSANPQSFVIASPPQAVGDVTLTFSAVADLLDTNEFIDVDINGTAVGTVFQVGASDCGSEVDQLVVPAATYNAALAGGDAIINMIPSSLVGAVCVSSTIDVVVRYSASNDCNGNGVPDACEPDCNANGIPDPCELVATFTADSGILSPIDSVDPQSFVIASPPQAVGDVTLAFSAVADLLDTNEFIDVDINGTAVGTVFQVGASDCGTEIDQLVVPAATYNAAVAGGDAVININPSSLVGAVCVSSTIDVIVRYSANNDCNGNGVPDECDIAAGTSRDCNANGIPDECDIAAGTSQDCNANGIPDGCDISSGTSQDCNSNSIPDECELDCNNNGIPDECDLSSGTSQDCNTNGVPDECEPDCNGNGVPDECDIAAGTNQDCNANGILDECDITSGTSQDCQPNGIPDECEIRGDLIGVSDPSVGPFLLRINMSDGSETFTGVMDQNIQGSLGLARQPVSGELFAIVKIGSTRPLAKIDPVTAAATIIGDPGVFLADIAFRSDGTLFGISGNNSASPGKIFTINTGDASLTTTGIVLGSGDGQSIAFQPGTDLLYHAFIPNSGNTLETIDVDTGTITIVNNTTLVIGELNSMTFSLNGSRLFGNDFGTLWSIDPVTGSAINLGTDFFIRITGMVFMANLSTDCNVNGIPDDCELAGADCNNNSIPDECDISAGSSNDTNSNGIPDECEAVPDQLHIVGPVPNQVIAGSSGTILATVESNFIAVPGREVVFMRLMGDFTFTSGTVSPDGTQTSITTDASGQATVSFTGNTVGTAVIQVTVTNSSLGSAFSLFNIVNPPLSSAPQLQTMSVPSRTANQ